MYPALQASWSACQFLEVVIEAPAVSKNCTTSTYLPAVAHMRGDRPSLSMSSKQEPASTRALTTPRWPPEEAR